VTNPERLLIPADDRVWGWRGIADEIGCSLGWLTERYDGGDNPPVRFVEGRVFSTRKALSEWWATLPQHLYPRRR
jgi:hypothetical protein